MILHFLPITQIFFYIISQGNSQFEDPEQNEMERIRRANEVYEKQLELQESYKTRRFQVVHSYPQAVTTIPRPTRRIMAGIHTSINVYPFMVAMKRDKRQWCGATVMDEQWLLTAAHCVEPILDNNVRRLKRFYVRAGSVYNNKLGYLANLNRIFLADEGYFPRSRDRDWALIRLDRPLPIGRKIAVINLPAKGLSIQPGDFMVTMGWGSLVTTGDGIIPPRLTFAPVYAIDNTLCMKYYEYWHIDIHKSNVCARWEEPPGGGRDVCKFDTGGPLISKGLQVGIVSVGNASCGEMEAPGVYSRTEFLSWWAEHVIFENEAYTIPELRPKIDEMRRLERELHHFLGKAFAIKDRLRADLTNNTLLKIRLKERMSVDGLFLRPIAEARRSISNTDAQAVDEINLTNLIHDRIIVNETDETDYLLSTLTLHEVAQTMSPEEHFPSTGVRRLNIDDIIETILQ